MIKLKRELIENLDTLEGLRNTLQYAIELEHSTIPPYLYARFSIKPGANKTIDHLIGTIVNEEMLHLGLAANILNAIGGSPAINQPGFVPSYPGPLPGGVDEGLIVPLKRLSLDLIHDIFMGIEEPEDPLNFPRAIAEDADSLTIGQFYYQIRKRINDAGDKIFTGDPARQVNLREYWPEAPTSITTRAEAVAAIDLIVEQGEGTPTTPIDLEGDIAHYYRFAEIYYGRTLIPNPNPPPNAPPDQKYIYGGDPIPFDPAGVHPVVDNPKVSSYPRRSLARLEGHAFNYTYTSLLNTLHDTFNGSPGKLTHAIFLMEILRGLAAALTATPLPDGQHAGPTFEYQTAHR